MSLDRIMMCNDVQQVIVKKITHRVITHAVVRYDMITHAVSQ